ncbi:elongation factor P maturation arginine rhamnosyltransferase EarP [Stutzerimonas marianensis]
MSIKARWDIFCVVVDNFGDIGVTWRLARQLSVEHGQHVRLWVDDLETFAQLCPGTLATADQQWHEGVEVRHWCKNWPGAEPADVVIEAFACQLPTDYIAAMAESDRRILWLNLEYLSAEDWVVGCHALPSMQADGLQKYFFFPGFEQGTGGLIREGDLIARREAFQRDPHLREAFLQSLDVDPLPGACLLSLFAYENEAVSEWLDTLAAGARPTQLLVPVGRVLGDVARWLGVDRLQAGDRHSRGALQIAVLPFVTQNQYDMLLWSCDFNAVRGEESFIRAQWAGRPLVWHIYPQEEGAHWDKLNAFLELYLRDLDPAAADALRAFWRAWNEGVGSGAAWAGLHEHQVALREHAERWTHRQVANGDLAGKLMLFHADWLAATPGQP